MQERNVTEIQERSAGRVRMPAAERREVVLRAAMAEF